MLEEEEEAAGSPRDRPRFRPRSEDKVLLSLSLSLFLPGVTMDFVFPTCLVSKVPSTTPLSPLSISLPLLLPLLSPFTSIHPFPPVVHHGDVLLFFFLSSPSVYSLFCTFLPLSTFSLSPFSSFTHSLFLCFVTSIILSRASPNLHLGKVFKRRPTYVKFVFEGSSFRLSYMFVPAAFFFPFYSMPFVSPVLVFQLSRLVCTVYLLNILLVLFRRSLSQINKLISLLSFSCLSLSFFLSLFLPLILTLLYTSSLSVVSSFWISGDRGSPRWGTQLAKTKYYANVITNSQ